MLDLGYQKKFAGAVARLKAPERTERWGARPLIYFMSGGGEANSGSSAEHGLAEAEVTLTVKRAGAIVR